jgi:hypothetical protein
MSTKITLLLLAITGLLLGFIFLYEKDMPKSWQASSREYYMLLFDRNSVEGIRLTSNEDPVELLKHVNQWMMEAPVKDRADQNAVAELLNLCEKLQKEPVAEGRTADKKLLKNFGVAKSAIRLKLLGPEMPPELLIGKETAVEGKVYARLEGSNNVSVVSSELRNFIVRKPDEFRDHRLADFDATSVTQVAVKTTAGEIELTRQAGHWGLAKPLKARADDAKVAAFLDSVLGTRIVAFQPDQSANLNSYGLSEPRGTVTFSATGRAQPVVLELGARDEKTGGVYARISTRGAVFLLPKESENILKLAPNDLRDRRLMRINLDLVDRITLRGAGKPPLILQRAQEDWVFRVETPGAAPTPRPANAAKVLQLVKELQTRPVTAFVTDVASDLAKYGLDQPQLRVTFSSYASENTAETNAGEAPILTLALGKTEGDIVYAREEDEPFVVAVNKSLLDEISLDAFLWRSLAVFGFKPGEIVGLDVTTYTEGVPRPPVSLVVKDGQWAADTGSVPGTLNAINIQSLVNTLASLKAMRWVERPSEVPAISETLEFKTQAGQTHKLMLGAPDPDQSCLAWLDGDANAAFRLSAPDASALRLVLVEALPKP